MVGPEVRDASNAAAAAHAAPPSRPGETGTVRFQRVVRSWSIGAGCGFLAGAALGLGLRLAMRVSGALTEGAARGVPTENGNLVGAVTLDTVPFVVFIAAVGAAGGVVLRVIRPLVPWQGRLRHTVVALGAMALLSPLLIDPGNKDFRLFGPLWLNLTMYPLLLAGYGGLLSVLVDHFERRLPVPPVTGRLLAAALVPVVLSLPTLPATGALLVFGAPAVVPAVVAAWLAAAVAHRAGRAQARASPRWSRGLMVAGCVAGALQAAANMARLP